MFSFVLKTLSGIYQYKYTSLSSLPNFLYSLIVQNLFSGDSPHSLFISVNWTGVIIKSSSLSLSIEGASYLNTSCFKLLNYLFLTKIIIDY